MFQVTNNDALSYERTFQRDGGHQFIELIVSDFREGFPSRWKPSLAKMVIKHLPADAMCFGDAAPGISCFVKALTVGKVNLYRGTAFPPRGHRRWCRNGGGINVGQGFLEKIR